MRHTPRSNLNSTLVPGPRPSPRSSLRIFSDPALGFTALIRPRPQTHPSPSPQTGKLWAPKQALILISSAWDAQACLVTDTHQIPYNPRSGRGEAGDRKKTPLTHSHSGMAADPFCLLPLSLPFPIPTPSFSSTHPPAPLGAPSYLQRRRNSGRRRSQNPLGKRGPCSAPRR